MFGGSKSFRLGFLGGVNPCPEIPLGPAGEIVSAWVVGLSPVHLSFW